MTRAMSRVITMDPNAGIQKLRAASCSVLLLLLTLALVASSLLVARYAVQVPYRVAGPPPPPPYALPDLPPSYSVSVAAADSSATPAPPPAPAAGPAPPQPAPGLEPPPPYAVAIKRDPLVQGATTGGSTDTAAVQAERAVDSCSDANSTSVLSFSVNGRGGGSVVVLGSGAPGVSARERERARSSNAANRRPILWY